MKFLVVALALFVAVSAVTDEQKERVRQHTQTCLQESGATPEELKKFKVGESTENVSENVKCFMKCFFRQSGFFNDADEFQTEVAVQKLSLGGENVEEGDRRRRKVQGRQW
ncbi:general odorant-binding protein 56a-like isoform X3 [Ctenocephalides felis]|uniref:general odorant-binding protein 56a-like isoform X2 n=1 Tax=Ctenocephalides felis TaxID=7515 RepID=UPI000E6E45AA|nr:general odorant-binding protein 56a-like isoform X2 [Ctenocephalides felis]XP_026480960.1 general odorant-binding protein 56a-like isoform X3 [Ctenocephalides felis]